MASPDQQDQHKGQEWHDDGQLAQRIAAIRARVAAAAERAGRAPESARIVAVSKTMPAEAVIAAARHGLRLFGENRVQEAREKIAAVNAAGLTDVRWELIGHLQTNKAARAVELFARVQSVDSLHLAEVLDARAHAMGHVLPILLEVNIAGEANKTGLAPEAVVNMARAVAAMRNLRPEGLMTVAPLVDDPEVVRPIFRRMRALRETLRAEAPIAMAEDGGWPDLSMGMTDDFEVAIEEGATLVRIGRAIFGERPPITATPEMASQ